MDQPATQANRRLRVGMGSLIALVACCAVVFWTWRVVRENPAIHEAARAVRQGRTVTERQAAARELGKAGPDDLPVAIPALIDALKDREGSVREEVTRALGSALDSAAAAGPGAKDETRAAAQALFRALDDKHPGVRIAAAVAFTSRNALKAATAPARGRVAEPGPFEAGAVLGRLAALLGDDDDAVREQAARSLGAIGGSLGTEPPLRLVETLKRDIVSSVRVAAEEAMGSYQTGDEGAVLALIDGLADGDVRVSQACRASIRTVRAMSPVVPALVRVMGKGEPRTAFGAVVVLGRVKPAAVGAIPALVDVAKGPPVLLTFAPYGGRRVLTSLDPVPQAARVLGEIAPGSGRADEVVGPLTELLHSDDTSRRTAAAWALGQLGPEAVSAVPALIAALTGSDVAKKTLTFESSVATALGATAPPSPHAAKAVAALTLAIGPETSNDDLLAAGAEALSRFGPSAKPAAARLRDLKGARSKTVSDAAAKALVAIGDPDASP